MRYSASTAGSVALVSVSLERSGPLLNFTSHVTAGGEGCRGIEPKYSAMSRFASAGWKSPTSVTVTLFGA